jgi:EAL domain-containing protein (putative c-di-GMP-specific phosphodiesterase class I)
MRKSGSANPHQADIEVLVKTIIALGKALNMTVVAEGVETLEQLELLRKPGCDEIQGYYFSRPLPKAESQKFCRNFGNRTECPP